MSSDPKRLLDDPSLGLVLRRDLERAQTSASQGYDKDAGLDRLRAAIVAGAVTTAGATTGAVAAKSGMLGSAKLWVVVGVSAVLAGSAVTWVATSDDGSTARPSVRETSAEVGPVESEPVEVEPVGVEPVEVDRAASPAPVELVVEPARGVVAVSPTPRATRASRSATNTASASEPTETGPSAVAATETAPPADPDAALRRETAHLMELRRTLESDPGSAIAMADRGSVEFRGGMFGEERAAITIFALFELGRDDDGRRRATRFLQAHPRGPFSTRVRQLVADAR